MSQPNRPQKPPPLPPVIPQTPPPLPVIPKTAPSVPPQVRAVSFNGVRLEDQQLQALEQEYRTRIPDGSYWYDRMCGAWGLEGGPCAGIIRAGMELGGSLRPEASNGNTGVFVNGRQLHTLDIMALQQITAVWPGRYWMDAFGNVGFEGGPALANLWALAAQHASGGSSVKREGILSTYDKTGVAVFGY